jgi:ApaG protein
VIEIRVVEGSGQRSSFASEAVTRGIRVRVVPQFDPQRSQPARGKWFFLYRVTIRNESHETVQLLTRHWVITDGVGRAEEVRGPGVVGEQPVLAPGEAFEYTSGCPLSMDVGKMEGSYQMVTEDGDLFDVTIAPFTLCEAEVVH